MNYDLKNNEKSCVSNNILIKYEIKVWNCYLKFIKLKLNKTDKEVGYFYNEEMKKICL